MANLWHADYIIECSRRFAVTVLGCLHLNSCSIPFPPESHTPPPSPLLFEWLLVTICLLIRTFLCGLLSAAGQCLKEGRVLWPPPPCLSFSPEASGAAQKAHSPASSLRWTPTVHLMPDVMLWTPNPLPSLGWGQCISSHSSTHGEDFRSVWK